jgi:tripartite-type tricarboxylate transporter receptor subunit TctC
MVRLKGFAIGAGLLSALSGATMAQEDHAKFYAGKTLQMIIRSEPGSGYDQYARTFARHVVKHIPGTPNIINRNMPGGGGITAANFVYAVAPNDGTVLTIVSQGLPASQALGEAKGLRADMSKFNWLGTLVSSNQLTITRRESQTNSFEAARKRDTIIGTVGAGSISTQIPVLLNKFTGTRLKLVTGYKGTEDLAIAMERGEIDGFAAMNMASLNAVFSHFLTENKINVIVQMGARRDPRLPDVPLMHEVAQSDEGKKIIEFFSRGVVVGRPLAVGPHVPADRVAMLREAFTRTVTDPEFLDEARKRNIEIQPTGWEELTALVDNIVGESKEIIDMARAAFQ